MLPSVWRITISDYYCSHTIVTILLAAPFLYQVQTCSVYLVWAMHICNQIGTLRLWVRCTLGTYISNCGDSARLRAGPKPAVQMSTDLAQKKTKAEDSTSLKLHKKGDDANMTILVIKITKHWPPCLTWIHTKVQGDFYMTCPDSAKLGKWIIVNICISAKHIQIW